MAARQSWVVRSTLSKGLTAGPLRARQIDFALIPRHRGHADQLLRAVKQRRKFLAGRLEGDLLQPFRSGAGAAHDIDALLEAVDAEELGLRLRIDAQLPFLARGGPAHVLNLQRGGRTVVRLVLPGLVNNRVAAGLVANLALDNVGRLDAGAIRPTRGGGKP